MGLLGLHIDKVEAKEQTARTTLFLTDLVTKGCGIASSIAEKALDHANKGLGKANDVYADAKQKLADQKKFNEAVQLLITAGLDPIAVIEQIQKKNS